ncbi:hypothetical protein NA56DRAFT_718159 [Hyaloscypha hepaticicola]|uniref:Killer toxin Kp4 domain-containing protein n=1 Tax=Hyaloscypha hepaticicola TaxID=2082293 RepID=A0A2J6QA18_9HELO|nr:hypothetical protein NA56DRAFT_718159 [Hyaloscypha hepaticicola]
MILSSLFAFAGFICLAHAFVVPQHTEGGVHGVDMDKRVANFLEDSSVPVRSATNVINNALAIRGGSTYTQPPDRIHCGCGFNLDPTNYDLAVKDMQTTLRNNNAADSFPANTTSIQGKVIAFVCKGGDQGAVPPVNEIGFFILKSRIQKACGTYTAGTYSIYHQTGVNNHGLMGYTTDLENSVCTSPDSAAATSC